jgi:hypothetical protein
MTITTDMMPNNAASILTNCCLKMQRHTYSAQPPTHTPWAAGLQVWRWWVTCWIVKNYKKDTRRTSSRKLLTKTSGTHLWAHKHLNLQAFKGQLGLASGSYLMGLLNLKMQHLIDWLHSAIHAI